MMQTDLDSHLGNEKLKRNAKYTKFFPTLIEFMFTPIIHLHFEKLENTCNF